LSLPLDALRERAEAEPDTLRLRPAEGEPLSAGDRTLGELLSALERGLGEPDTERDGDLDLDLDLDLDGDLETLFLPLAGLAEPEPGGEPEWATEAGEPERGEALLAGDLETWLPTLAAEGAGEARPPLSESDMV